MNCALMFGAVNPAWTPEAVQGLILAVLAVIGQQYYTYTQNRAKSPKDATRCRTDLRACRSELKRQTARAADLEKRLKACEEGKPS